ncbi:hypothetical protein FUT69_05035 [Xylella taiwanensis]|uniref:Uncharacterized protein n=1 Tax=Xylella taiwanensis TaxID=1444770 RepID=Z9JJP9_9GAMM|nr:hypothetical protein [Xylella taiwanensis]EWS78630.1 hypothetical protein AF72_04690 [Xylella taiwanensis]MCD8455766.1 hypothetical protein [Xylella taiwanensis]MCD8458171.1 hypothetical protein [Xylella taiwanensis]MCD8460307.1 hypothetical protein [Xylella taiwanensis]MCD8463635.1 hypothetical protein [Xylella taiwanensis]
MTITAKSSGLSVLKSDDGITAIPVSQRFIVVSQNNVPYEAGAVTLIHPWEGIALAFNPVLPCYRDVNIKGCVSVLVMVMGSGSAYSSTTTSAMHAYATHLMYTRQMIAITGVTSYIAPRGEVMSTDTIETIL